MSKKSPVLDLFDDITETAPELKARIRFDDYGEKLLLLTYAKLRPERK